MQSSFLNLLFFANSINTSFIFSILFFSTAIPVLSVSISGDPPVLYVITGNPQAKASIFTVGKVSCFVKLINASLALYISHSSLTVFVLGIHNAFSIVVVFEDNVPPTTTNFIF